MTAATKTRRVCARCNRKLSDRTGFVFSSYTRSYYCAPDRWASCDRIARKSSAAGPLAVMCAQAESCVPSRRPSGNGEAPPAAGVVA